MIKKQDCPYCNKPNIDGRHLRLCSKRLEKPQDEAESPLIKKVVDLPVPAEIPILETISNPEKLETEDDSILECLQCGGPAKKLNAIDWHCPKCGDYDSIAVRRIK